MTRRIRTPEDIFREERRDVYALEFTQKGTELQKAMRAMAQWLGNQLPASLAEPMAPSQQDGWLWLEGVPSNLSLNFAEGDLVKFFQHWLTPNGQSKDPRFICRFYSYSQWWEQHGHYTPTLAKPLAPNVALWIESPLGILSHCVTDTDLTQHPSTVEDLWANACEKWPHLQGLKLVDLRRGSVDKTSQNPMRWCFIWEAPSTLCPDPDNPATWHSIMNWLCLPPDTPIHSLW